jgi:SAM-dependent methyltransferase
MMDSHAHWETVYTEKAPTDVSWYQPHLQTSLTLILKTGVGKEGHIIDIGGGASTLVDDLLAAGFHHLTVLDISAEALETARIRVAGQGHTVTWIAADITDACLPPNSYDIWHDRALFHFLTNPQDRQRYVMALRQTLKPGGFVILATFAEDGPTQCSGLEVARYSCPSLQSELDDAFELLESCREEHTTPWNTQQAFSYCLFRRGGA